MVGKQKMSTMLKPNRLIQNGKQSGFKVSIQGSEETEGWNCETRRLTAFFRKTDRLSQEFPGITLRTVDREWGADSLCQSEWSLQMCLSRGDSMARRVDTPTHCCGPMTWRYKSRSAFSGAGGRAHWLDSNLSHSTWSHSLLAASRDEFSGLIDPSEIIFSPMWRGLIYFWLYVHTKCCYLLMLWLHKTIAGSWTYDYIETKHPVCSAVSGSPQERPNVEREASERWQMSNWEGEMASIWRWQCRSFSLTRQTPREYNRICKIIKTVIKVNSHVSFEIWK